VASVDHLVPFWVSALCGRWHCALCVFNIVEVFRVTEVVQLNAEVVGRKRNVLVIWELKEI
jgi:hypothetical protein